MHFICYIPCSYNVFVDCHVLLFVTDVIWHYSTSSSVFICFWYCISRLEWVLIFSCGILLNTATLAVTEEVPSEMSCLPFHRSFTSTACCIVQLPYSICIIFFLFYVHFPFSWGKKYFYTCYFVTSTLASFCCICKCYIICCIWWLSYINNIVTASLLVFVV
jgi:hypothetical protein